MDNIKVSVIIPVYNAKEYLRETLNSVLEQSLHDIEVICIDDGSMDDSMKILEEYAKQDCRVKVMSQENKGAGLARNKGMTVAKGKYIAFMDSDDLYPEQDTLKKLVQAAEKHGCRVIGGYKQAIRGSYIYDVDWDKIYQVIKENPNGCLKKYSELQTDFNYYCYIFDREMLVQENITFPDYRRFQDPPFFVRAMCAAETVYLVPYPTYLYRRGHQEIAWDTRRINDLIRGHIDVLTLARKHNLQALYVDVSKRLNSEYKPIVFQNYSLENLDLYLLLVKLSTIKYPEKNNGTRELVNILADAEWRLYQLIAAQCKKGGNWLSSLLMEIKTRYLKIDSSGEMPIARSLLRVLKGLFTPNTAYQARVMLRECLLSPEYQVLGLNAYADSEIEAIKVLNRVEPAFNFVEEIKRKREGVDYCVIHDCSVDCPKFSVIIPVYNVAPYLTECLDSVVNQTLKDIEIICVDDGSTDESFNILMEYAQKYTNIKILQEANSGLAVARNQGLKVAKGEYIHFLDSDDFVKPETYETLYRLMTAHDLDILLFNADIVYENEELEKKHSQHKTAYSHDNDIGIVQSGTEYYVRAILDNNFATTACMCGIRKSLLEKEQISFLPGVLHEDNFFMNVCFLLAKKFMHIKQPFYCYRIRENSLTTMGKEFRHTYGCFANYCAFCEFLSERKFDIDVRSAATKRLSVMLSVGYNTYKNIKEDQQRYYYLALPPEEGLLFEQLFYERYIIEQKLQQGKLESTKNKLSASDKKLKDTEKKLKASLSREASLKNSVSFRTGRAITWFPRKVRGGVRCLKDHGPGYTVEKFFWHITHFK